MVNLKFTCTDDFFEQMYILSHPPIPTFIPQDYDPAASSPAITGNDTADKEFGRVMTLNYMERGLLQCFSQPHLRFTPKQLQWWWDVRALRLTPQRRSPFENQQSCLDTIQKIDQTFLDYLAQKNMLTYNRI